MLACYGSQHWSVLLVFARLYSVSSSYVCRGSDEGCDAVAVPREHRLRNHERRDNELLRRGFPLRMSMVDGPGRAAGEDRDVRTVPVLQTHQRHHQVQHGSVLSR